MLDQIRERSRGRAIISDDDEFFRVAIQAVLRDRLGFSEVIVTASFDEAVDRLATAGAVEIGLFDLNMVGMENWQDLSALRVKFPDMRLLVVSASRHREDILRALGIGAHGFVNKGQGISELSRAIELICAGQVYVPPFLPENPAGNPPACFAAAETVSDADPVIHADPPSTVRDLAPQRKGKPLQCTPRQREVIELLIAGHSNKSMARLLSLSEGTIKFHMSAVLRLLGVNSRVEAATRAMKQLEG